MDQREAFKLSNLAQLSRTQGHPAFFARSSLCVESSNLSFNLNMIKAFTSNHPQPRSIFWPFRPFSDRRRFKISLLFKRYLRLRSGWVEASQTRVRGFDSRRVLVLFYVFVLNSYLWFPFWKLGTDFRSLGLVQNLPKRSISFTQSLNILKILLMCRELLLKLAIHCW